MQPLSKERTQDGPNSLPSRRALQMPRRSINEACQHASPEETFLLTSRTDGSRTVTPSRLFRRRRKDAPHFKSQSASNVQEFHSVAAGAHSPEAEYAPRRMLRCNHFLQDDMITAWPRSHQTYSVCNYNRETSLQQIEQAHSGMPNLPFPAEYLASSDKTCTAVQTKAKTSDRQRDRQQNGSLRALKETIATEVRHSLGRDEKEGRLDATPEETVPYALSHSCANVIAGEKDGGTERGAPITHTAVKSTPQGEALYVRLQPKQEDEALEQANAQDKSSTMQNTARQEETTASAATVLQSRELLVNASARKTKASQNLTEVLRRIQAGRSSKCVNGEENYIVESIRPHALEEALKMLETSRSPGLQACSKRGMPMHTPANAVDTSGPAVCVRENVVLEKKNHFMMIEAVSSKEGATSSVCTCFAPSSSPSTQTSKQPPIGECALPEGAACSLCYKAETTALEASCSHVKSSIQELTRTADTQAGLSLSPGSLCINRNGTDRREGKQPSFSQRRMLHVGSSPKTNGAPLASSISDRTALLNSAAGGTTERTEDNKCLRDKDGFRQWSTIPFMRLMQTVTATKLTPAAAVSDSGSSTFLKKSSTAPLHLLGCRKTRRLLRTGSSRQASIRDATNLHRTAAISRDTTACEETSEWLSAEESHTASPLRGSSLCCCCDCCSSSIVITTASELFTDQNLAPLYPIPPPPRKFYDMQGNRVSGKPGWYGHNYPSFRSTRIQQCGLLYSKWRRGHLRIGTIVLLLLQEAVKLLLFTIKRVASSTFHTVHDSAPPSVRQTQYVSNSSVQELPMSADSFVQEEHQLLDQLLVGRDAQRQQQLPHVCALPYCQGTTPLQRSNVCPCNVTLHRRTEQTSYTPEERNRDDSNAGEPRSRRSRSKTRLPSACENIQLLSLNDTDGAQRELRWNTNEEDSKALLRSSVLLKLAAQKASHMGEKDGQDRATVEIGGVQRGHWLYIEGAAEAGLLEKNRNKRKRAYSRRARHKLPQEAGAVAELFPKKSFLPDRFFHSFGGVRHMVGHNKEKITLIDHGTVEGNLYRGKVKQREGDAKLLSDFRMRLHIGGTFICPLLGLFVPGWLQAPVNSLLVQLTTRLALLPRGGLLQRRMSLLLTILRQLLFEGPKELVLYLMPTFVADTFKKAVKEWESLGVPDSQTRRCLKFFILLLIMYPFVHGFYVPCLVLLWLVRRAYDAFWCFCATSCCSYCTSKQLLRRWQDQVHKQQLKLQQQQSFQKRIQWKAQWLEHGGVPCRDEQQKGLQKKVSKSGRRLQAKQVMPAMLHVQQPGVQQDARKDSSEHQREQDQERPLEYIEHQRQQRPQREERKEGGAAKQCLQQQFQPQRSGWHIGWSQLRSLPVSLMEFFHRRSKHARGPPARKESAYSSQRVAAPENMMAQLYSHLCRRISLLRATLNRCALLPFRNTVCFLNSLPSRHTFSFFKSQIARPFKLNLWSQTTAAAVVGKANFLHFLRRVNTVVKASRSCKPSSDACSKDEAAKCRAVLLLRNIFLVNPSKTPHRIVTSVKGKILAGKKALLCGRLGWTTRDNLGRRAITLLKAGFSVVNGFRQGNRGRADQRETEILGLLNGQELVLFSQPHMVVCGVGYTEKLTREELLQVIRKKLLVQRGGEATQHEQQRREEDDDDGLTHRQKRSEKRARKKAKKWKERTGEREREAHEDIRSQYSDEEEWSDGILQVRKTGKENDEEEETLKQRRKGNEKQRWERNATENNSDEDSTVPLLRFKHPRLRTAVKKVLNRYCWVRDENFSAARHVISLNRQQVLMLLALHQGQHSPTDFVRFKQNLALQEAGSRKVHSISCCKRCNRKNVPKEEETEEWTKMEVPCKKGIAGWKEREGTVEQRVEERVSGKQGYEGTGKERTLNSGRAVHRAAGYAQPPRSKVQLKWNKKGKPTGAGGETNFSVDQLNSRWNRMAAHTHCSCSRCQKRDKMFSSDRVPSSDCPSSTSTSEQRVEERISTREKLVFKCCNGGDTRKQGDILSRTGKRHRYSNEKYREEESVRGISIRSGCDSKTRNEDGGAFSPRQSLASSSPSRRSNPNVSEQKEKDGLSNQMFPLSRSNDSEERESEGFASEDVFVSQVSSGFLGENEKGSSRERERCCIVRREEAQALLTLLASQTLPPGLPLWQFVLLESVEIPPPMPAASDITGLEKGKRNTSLQEGRHQCCNAVALSIEEPTAAARYRISHHSADAEDRSVQYEGHVGTSRENGKATAVQRSQRALASNDRDAGRKRRSSTRAVQSVQSLTTTRVKSRSTSRSLMETSANVKNMTETGGVLCRKWRSFGTRREERDSFEVRRTASVKHSVGNWRKVITTSYASLLKNTADDVEEEIYCLQAATGDSGEKEVTNREPKSGCTRKPVVRRKPRETGDCIAENSGGVGELSKGRLNKSEEPCIGSMIIFRVHHSVADGIALTNMFLSDVFTASPLQQRNPCSLVEQDNSSLALSAAQKYDLSAAPCAANVSASSREEEIRTEQMQHTGIKEGSEGVGEREEETKEKQKWSGEMGCNAGRQNPITGMRPKTLQPELPSFTPSTTAASSPASRGQRLDGDNLGRCCTRPLIQRDQNLTTVGPDAGATGSAADATGSAVDSSSFAAVATAPSSAVPSACSESRAPVGVSTPVATDAAGIGRLAGSVPSPAVSGVDSSGHLVSSLCSASDSLMTTDSVLPGINTVPAPNALLVFSTEEDSLTDPCHNHSASPQTKEISCPSKSPRCHSRIETSSTKEPASHSRPSSENAALARAVFTAKVENRPASAPGPIKPMVPPITPPSLLPRLLIQIIAYLRIPWEVCSLLVLRRDRSWDSVVQPRRQRAGWAHEVHSIRFDLQQLRKLRRYLSTAAVGDFKKPIQPSAAFICRRSAPLPYTRILRMLQPAVSVAFRPLVFLQQQLFTRSLIQRSCSTKPFLYSTCGHPIQPSGPAISDTVAATASVKAADAASERPAKLDAAVLFKSVVATQALHWTPIAVAFSSVLPKSTTALIKFSVAALEKAAEVVGEFFSPCLKRRRCKNISAGNPTSRARSATISSPGEAASGTFASNSAATTNSFTINELLTSCVAGGVSRYIRAMTAEEHSGEAAAKTQTQDTLHSSRHLERFNQPARISLTFSSGQASRIAKVFDRRLASKRRHAKTHKTQDFSSHIHSEDKGRSTAASCFNDLSETLLIDEAVFSAKRAMPVRHSSDIRRWRRRSISSTRDYQTNQAVYCRETCRRRVRHEDTPALPPARHIAARCVSRTSSSQFMNSGRGNSNVSDTILLLRKREAYGKEGTWTDGGPNAQRGCISAATSSSDILCPTAINLDSVHEANRVNDECAFPRSTYGEGAPHTAERCSTNAACRAWKGATLLGRRNGDRIAKAQSPVSKKGLLSQRRSQSCAGLKMGTPSLSWDMSGKRPHHGTEALTDVEGFFRETLPSAGVTSLAKTSEAAEARATTFRPMPPLTDVNITWKERRCVVALYTYKKRPANKSKCLEQPIQPTTNGKEHTCAGRRVRPFTLETRHVDRPVTIVAASKAAEREPENKKTAKAEGLQQIQQSLLDLNIVVPVNLRTTEEDSFQLHNNFTSVVVQLAVADLFFADTAYERLVKVRAKLRRNVRSAGASVFALMEKICFATTPDFTWFLHMWLTNKLSMLLSNVPGPSVLPQIHGRQVYMMNFIGSLVGKVGINASAFSYANSLDLVFHIDRAVLASPELLRQCILDEYQELEQLCTYC